MRTQSLFRGFTPYSFLTEEQVAKFEANTGYTITDTDKHPATVLDLESVYVHAKDPYIFIVEDFMQLKEVYHWYRRRPPRNDAVMDINGVTVPLARLVEPGMPWNYPTGIILLDEDGNGRFKFRRAFPVRFDGKEDDWSGNWLYVKDGREARHTNRDGALFAEAIVRPYVIRQDIEITDIDAIRKLIIETGCTGVVEVGIPFVGKVEEDDLVKVPHVEFQYIRRAVLKEDDKLVSYTMGAFIIHKTGEESFVEENLQRQSNVTDISKVRYDEIKDILQRLGRPEVDVNEIEKLIPTVDMDQASLRKSIEFALTWL